MISVPANSHPTYIDSEGVRLQSWLLVFFVLLFSGNPAVNVLGKETVVLLPPIIITLVSVYRRPRIVLADLLIIAFFTLICTLQWMNFGGITIPSSGNMLLRIATALMLARLVPDLAKRYVSVMYVLAVTSLIFFIPTFLGIPLETLFESVRIPLERDQFHIGIHHFIREYDESLNRNSGMFWEPGAFAGYLAVALILAIQDLGSLPRRHVIVIVIALLSTQSTTGYIVFAAVLLTFLLTKVRQERRPILRAVLFLLIPTALIGAAVAYESLDFLSDKIATQWEGTVSRDEGYHTGRFGNFFYDLEFIQERPVVGWSASEETRLVSIMEIEGQGNGFSGFAVRYGLLGLFGYLAFVWAGFRRFLTSGRLATGATAIVALLLWGEQYLNYPFFFVFMFLPRRAAGSVAPPTDFRWKPV